MLAYCSIELYPHHSCTCYYICSKISILIFAANCNSSVGCGIRSCDLHVACVVRYPVQHSTHTICIYYVRIYPFDIYPVVLSRYRIYTFLDIFCIVYIYMYIYIYIFVCVLVALYAWDMLSMMSTWYLVFRDIFTVRSTTSTHICTSYVSFVAIVRVYLLVEGICTHILLLYFIACY